MIQGYLDKNTMFPVNLGWDFLGCARAFAAQVRGPGVPKPSGVSSIISERCCSTACFYSCNCKRKGCRSDSQNNSFIERLTFLNTTALIGIAVCINHQFPAPAPFAAATKGDDNSNSHFWDTWLVHRALLWARWMNALRQDGYTFCISLLHFYHVANNSTKMLQK